MFGTQPATRVEIDFAKCSTPLGVTVFGTSPPAYTAADHPVLNASRRHCVRHSPPPGAAEMECYWCSTPLGVTVFGTVVAATS